MKYLETEKIRTGKMKCAFSKLETFRVGFILFERWLFENGNLRINSIQHVCHFYKSKRYLQKTITAKTAVLRFLGDAHESWKVAILCDASSQLERCGQPRRCPGNPVVKSGKSISISLCRLRLADCGLKVPGK